jgi:hypothetical protein
MALHPFRPTSAAPHIRLNTLGCGGIRAGVCLISGHGWQLSRDIIGISARVGGRLSQAQLVEQRRRVGGAQQEGGRPRRRNCGEPQRCGLTPSPPIREVRRSTPSTPKRASPNLHQRTMFRRWDAEVSVQVGSSDFFPHIRAPHVVVISAANVASPTPFGPTPVLQGRQLAFGVAAVGRWLLHQLPQLRGNPCQHHRVLEGDIQHTRPEPDTSGVRRRESERIERVERISIHRPRDPSGAPRIGCLRLERPQ